MNNLKTLLLIGCFLFACSTQLTPTKFNDGGLDIPAEIGRSYQWGFEDFNENSMPSGFFNVLGEWGVGQDAGTKLLRQSGQYHKDDFPRVVIQDITFTNLRLKVTCRPETGETDQACGIMFRIKDSDNYYIARANALENNIRFYRVIASDRQLLATADVEVKTGDWHFLSAEARGESIKISLDEKDVISLTDSTFLRGKVGLWTKADSIVSFDDIEAMEISP